MRHLSPMVLAQIRALLPQNAHFVLVVATEAGTGIDTSIMDPKMAKMFMLETAQQMLPQDATCIYDTDGDGDCHLCVRDRKLCPIRKGVADVPKAAG